MKSTYKQTLHWLFNQLPMYQRVGKSAYKADLVTTEQLDAYFGHPHKHFRTIHVAGTNGKGSVAHMLASVLQAAGYKVGLYTSPHLRDFRERIKIDGKPVTEQQVVDFTDSHKAVFEDLQPSFFEMTVAMAFQLFKEAHVEVAVVEVGMGGRLDSTNIIRPDLSIITNISLDHTQFLGTEKRAIAGEKAGIMKPGVPVVIGTDDAELREVFVQKALETGAPLYFAHECLQLLPKKGESGWQQFIVAQEERHQMIPDRVILDLLGSYQRENLRTVLTALTLLDAYQITEQHVTKGLMTVVQSTGLLGRYQWLSHEPPVLCDTGHNEAGLKEVLTQLQNENFDALHIVLGVVNDKSVENILPMFPKDAHYYFTQASIPRALPAKELAGKAGKHGLEGGSYASVAKALEAAKSKAKGSDLIFIGGSTFVVAEVV